MANTTYSLHNGKALPALGCKSDNCVTLRLMHTMKLILSQVGTYRMKTVEELRPVVTQAVRSGYRLIDTATVYKNETALGSILKEIFADPSFGIQRGDLFITSKLSPQHQGYEKCYQAVLDSLDRLGLDYLDLYLIHWPGTSKTKLSDPVNQHNRTESYRALETLYSNGKVKQIGISNYTPAHLRHLLAHATITPHVHQFELHPCLHQPELIDLCHSHGIQIQAYSSLGEGKLIDGTVCVTGLDDIAARSRSTPPLVLLRWALQHHFAVIPKSTSPRRVQENAGVWNIDLSKEDMDHLDSVYKTQTHRFCWDSTEIY